MSMASAMVSDPIIPKEPVFHTLLDSMHRTIFNTNDQCDQSSPSFSGPAAYSADQDPSFLGDLNAFLDKLWTPPDGYTIIPRSQGDQVSLTRPPVLQSMCPQCSDLGLAFRTESMLPILPKEAMIRYFESGDRADPNQPDKGTRRNVLRLVRNITSGPDGGTDRRLYVRKSFSEWHLFLRERDAGMLVNDHRLPHQVCWEFYGGFPSLVYVYVDGDHSAHHLYRAAYNCHPSNRQHLTASIVRIVAQTIGAIAYLHSLGLVHGDIKSDNIIVDKDGNAHLIDLDRAKPVALLVNSGTRDFICPEMRGCVKGPIGKASDFWSLGIVVLQWYAVVRAAFLAREMDSTAYSTAYNAFFAKNPCGSEADAKEHAFVESEAVDHSECLRLLAYKPVTFESKSGRMIVNPAPFVYPSAVSELAWHLLQPDLDLRTYDSVPKLVQLYSVSMLNHLKVDVIEERCRHAKPPKQEQLEWLHGRPVEVHGRHGRSPPLVGKEPFTEPVFLPAPNRNTKDGKKSIDPSYVHGLSNNDRLNGQLDAVLKSHNEQLVLPPTGHASVPSPPAPSLQSGSPASPSPPSAAVEARSLEALLKSEKGSSMLRELAKLNSDEFDMSYPWMTFADANVGQGTDSSDSTSSDGESLSNSEEPNRTEAHQ